MAVVATEAWTGSNGAAWPAQWTGRTIGSTGSSTIQSNRGRQSASGAAYTSRLDLLSLGAVADFDLLIDLGLGNGTAEQYPGVHFRVETNITSGLPIGYLLEFWPGSDQVVLIDTETDVELVTVNAAGIANTTRRNLRIRCVGTSIRARWWNVGNSEPGTWQIDATDSNHPSGRYLLGIANGNSTTARTVDWDNLSIDDLAVTGTITTTWGALAATSTGARAVSGAASATWSAVTATAAGVRAVTGAITTTPGGLDAVGAGIVGRIGSTSPAFGALAAVAVGEVGHSGNVSTTLGAFGATAAGIVIRNGDIGTQFGTLTATAIGDTSSPNQGSISITWGELTGSAAGVVEHSGTITSTIGGLTGSASGVRAVIGRISTTWGTTQPGAAGVVGRHGAIDTTLGALTATAAGIGDLAPIVAVTGPLRLVDLTPARLMVDLTEPRTLTALTEPRTLTEIR